MPDIFNEGLPGRVIVRHEGPPGKGLPPGGGPGQILVKTGTGDYTTAWANAPDGTDAVLGPIDAVDGNFALFDGVTGKLIKDSGRALSYFATVSQLNLKVDKVSGKGLSTEDFTTAEKTKLASLNNGGFRGVFATFELLTEAAFDPAPVAGDYAYIEAGGDTVVLALWDSTNEEWTEFSLTVTYDGQSIADVLFSDTDAPDWEKAECRILTSTEKSQIAAHESILTALGFVGIIAYGGISYFGTGTIITFPGVSDGLTNMTKVTVATGTIANTANFDNGGSDNGRLRYIGTPSKVFLVNFTLALDGAGTGDYVVAVAKNGAVVSETRVALAVNASGETQSASGSAIVSLLQNEYVELFIGRTAGALDPNILSVNVVASPL